MRSCSIAATLFPCGLPQLLSSDFVRRRRLPLQHALSQQVLNAAAVAGAAGWSHSELTSCSASCFHRGAASSLAHASSQQVYGAPRLALGASTLQAPRCVQLCRCGLLTSDEEVMVLQFLHCDCPTLVLLLSTRSRAPTTSDPAPFLRCVTTRGCAPRAAARLTRSVARPAAPGAARRAARGVPA